MDISKAGIRIARVLIAIVFLLNALGVIDGRVCQLVEKSDRVMIRL